MQGWTEDLRGIANFEELPEQAKQYISEMFSSLIEVAFPNGYADIKLPKIRFIGVGPDPGEIISDLPSPEDLLSYSRSAQLSAVS